MSELDSSAPLVAIITGMRGGSANPKTGPMAQLWILRSDMSPLDAIQQRLTWCLHCCRLITRS
jgi:hypothetical protein